MNQLTEQLRAADSVCTQAYPFFEQAEEIRTTAEAKIAKSRKNKRTFKIIAVLAIITLLPSIISSLSRALFGNAGVVIAFPVMVVLGVCTYMFVINPVIEQNARIKENAYEESIARAGELETTGATIFADNASILAVIPEEYRYPMATGYILNIVATGRADNINQALQMYDEQLHRWNVESANAEILAHQREQTTALKGIRKSSAINAAANVANAAVNIGRWL